jgi:predicted secreted Zn-dependent protease
MIKPLLAAALLCSFAAAAHAGVTSKTNYHYFTVRGGSASSIYRSLESGSSLVDARRTIANTEYTISSSGVKSSGTPCRVTGINVSITYDIHLPRLADESDLSPGLRRDWHSFVSYLKGHEDHHRALWQACVARYYRSAQSLIGSDCGNIDAKLDARWAGPERSCRAQNDAYSEYALRAVHSQPFFRRTLGDD